MNNVGRPAGSRCELTPRLKKVYEYSVAGGNEMKTASAGLWDPVRLCGAQLEDLADGEK